MEINLKTWQWFAIFAVLFFIGGILLVIFGIYHTYHVTQVMGGDPSNYLIAANRGTVLALAGVCCFILSGVSAIVAAIFKRSEY